MRPTSSFPGQEVRLLSLTLSCSRSLLPGSTFTWSEISMWRPRLPDEHSKSPVGLCCYAQRKRACFSHAWSVTATSGVMTSHADELEVGLIVSSGFGGSIISFLYSMIPMFRAYHSPSAVL